MKPGDPEKKPEDPEKETVYSEKKTGYYEKKSGDPVIKLESRDIMLERQWNDGGNSRAAKLVMAEILPGNIARKYW